MIRTGFRTAALASGLLLVAGALASCMQNPSPGTSGSPASVAARRPNIVLIVADDLGYADVGVFGSEIPTPNLDQLARGGKMLTNFYTHVSCSPTRAMLMSGMDNHLAGMGTQGPPSRADQKGQPGYEGHLNFRVAALAELMTDAGYNTYMTGKWHLGNEVETGPRARGFRRSFVSLDGAAHLGGWDWRGPQPAKYRDGDEIVNVGDDFYTTRFYTERMLQYIDQDRAEGKPFFAFLAYTAPHWPLQAPDESIARFKGRYDAGYESLYASRFARQKQLGLVARDAQPIDNARFKPRWGELSEEDRKIEARRMEVYAAMVSDLDIYIGKVVDHLKKIGEYDNTFIMFISDNGAEPGRRDLVAPIKDHVGKEYDHSLANIGRRTSYVMYGPNWASAGASPFFRHKGTTFEGGVHVPAFVYFPRLVKAGTRSDAVGTVRDILPTFLELAGTKHPGTAYKGRVVLPVQGESMLPMLSDKAAAVHAPDTVYGWELFGARTIRQGDWKLVWDQTLPAAARRWQLFDIRRDPFEQRDLSTSEPEQFARLQREWDNYAARNGVIY